VSISQSQLAQTVELSRTTSIHPNLSPGDQISADLCADAMLLGRLDFQANHEGPRRVPALEFQLPTAASELTLRGKLQRGDGRCSLFCRRWRLLKLGSLTATLYNGTSMASALLSFERRLDALAKHSDGRFRSPMRVSMIAPTPHAAFVRAAIEMVGFLPGELVDMCRLRVAIGSGAFVPPTQTQTVAHGLRERGLFGTGANDAWPWLSQQTRARYQRSLLVFLDAPLGIALGWDPHDVRPGEATNSILDLDAGGAVLGQRGRGVWYWIHTTRIDEPELVLSRDRTPSDATSALMQVVQRLAIAGAPGRCNRPDALADYLLESASARIAQLGADFLITDNARPGDAYTLSFDQTGARPQLRSLDCLLP
jgi:hypothetical protein